ncbi:MAG: hydrogenase 4 subunit B, partial [Methylosarcina sp.]
MILILAYLAVLLSFTSGIATLLMNQRNHLLAISRFCYNKYPKMKDRFRLENAEILDEHRFPILLTRFVFVLLGLSGVFAVLAGLGVLISPQVITDQIGLGLPWLPWHVRFDNLSGFFFLIVGIAVNAVSLYGPGYV